MDVAGFESIKKYERLGYYGLSYEDLKLKSLNTLCDIVTNRVIEELCSQKGNWKTNKQIENIDILYMIIYFAGSAANDCNLLCNLSYWNPWKHQCLLRLENLGSSLFCGSTAVMRSY